jgi:hypothetical protein
MTTEAVYESAVYHLGCAAALQPTRMLIVAVRLIINRVLRGRNSKRSDLGIEGMFTARAAAVVPMRGRCGPES